MPKFQEGDRVYLTPNAADLGTVVYSSKPDLNGVIWVCVQFDKNGNAKNYPPEWQLRKVE